MYTIFCMDINIIYIDVKLQSLADKHDKIIYNIGRNDQVYDQVYDFLLRQWDNQLAPYDNDMWHGKTYFVTTIIHGGIME